MSTVVTARIARADSGAFRYQRHQPEKTLLYQLVLKHYPDFRRQLAEEGRVLPDYVQREFEDYLKCGRLEHGFIPGILPSTPPGPAYGCSNTFPTYLSAGTMLCRGQNLIDRAGLCRSFFAAPGGSDPVPVGAIGMMRHPDEDAMEAGEIHPGYGYQGGEPGDEVERLKNDVRGPGPQAFAAAKAFASLVPGFCHV
jgi:hypothetical protein